MWFVIGKKRETLWIIRGYRTTRLTVVVLLSFLDSNIKLSGWQQDRPRHSWSVCAIQHKQMSFGWPFCSNCLANSVNDYSVWNVCHLVSQIISTPQRVLLFNLSHSTTALDTHNVDCTHLYVCYFWSRSIVKNHQMIEKINFVKNKIFLELIYTNLWQFGMWSSNCDW